MQTIDKKKALALLKRVIDREGGATVYMEKDKRYFDEHECCRYITSKGAPQCLVGEVLVRDLGLDWKPLLAQNNFGIMEISGLWPDDIYFTPGALDVLGLAQDAQDSGCTWADALKSARQTGKDL